VGGIGEHLRSNVVGYVAVFLALTGSAAALQGRNSVNSGDIKPRNVKRSDLARNSVDSAKVINGSLLGEDFAAGQLPRGATGEAGPQGPAGSPDTPEDVLGKLQQVDGAGSGLDADQLDGLDASAFQRTGVATAAKRFVDDPTPGDGGSLVATLYQDANFQVQGACGQDVGGPDERADVTVFKQGTGKISIAAWGTNGTAVHNPDLSTGLNVLTFTSNINDIRGVFFVVTAANGRVMSGSASAEVNDTDAPAGTDCTFAATLLAP